MKDNRFIFKVSSLLVRYFMQGLLVIAPLAVTAYVLYATFMWLDHLIEVDVPGLGVLIILGGILTLGFLASSILAKPFFNLLESLLKKIPVINIIYSALKDFVDAFVGKDRKFKHPVLVTINKENNLHKIGFVTRESLENMEIKEMIAVYVPHSYNFSGDLFIVSKENIRSISGNSAEVMKFVVSGGVSGMES
ncbi:MAG: DUF502 domain-containing protein [Cytophagales bacterium]